LDTTKTKVFELNRTITNQELAQNVPTLMQMEIHYDSLKDHISDHLTMVLKIYGQDEQFWKGNYGIRFTGLFIRGDELKEKMDIEK